MQNDMRMHVKCLKNYVPQETFYLLYMFMWLRNTMHDMRLTENLHEIYWCLRRHVFIWYEYENVMHLFQNSMHDMQSNDTMKCMFTLFSWDVMYDKKNDMHDTPLR